MSDDEDYNSEEDIDYVPSEGEQVSEEENSGDEEDLSLLQDGEAENGPGKLRQTGKKKKAVLTARKRNGGIKLDDGKQENGEEEKEISEEETKRKKELADQIAKEEEERKQNKEKKRADDVWASFMADVGKPSARSSNQPSVGSGLGSLTSCQAKPTTTTSAQNKVTITKVFDFAGEEVKVTKEVDANSKEAQQERQKQEEKAVEDKNEVQKKTLEIPQTSLQPSSSLKRPGGGGLGSVLNKIGKKSKMGTLEKSKLDWESFKTSQGIQDDLKIHNKGKQGYTERMAFLNRTDQRQYTIERDIRMGTAASKR